MGSPVSIIVAEIVIQAIEERAIATYQQTHCTIYINFHWPLYLIYWSFACDVIAAMLEDDNKRFLISFSC